MQAHWETTVDNAVKKLPFLFAPFDGSLERRIAQYVAPDLQLEFPNDLTSWTAGASFGEAFNAATLTERTENPKKYDKRPYPFIGACKYTETTPAPPPRLNVLYFPTIASRFAHILAIFDDEDVKVGTKLTLKTDVPIIKNAPFFFGITEQKTLDLYVVTKRPIDLTEGEGWNAPKKPAVCLLVDWRYFMRGAQFEALYNVQNYPFGTGKKSVSTTASKLDVVLKSCFWKVFKSGFFTEEDWTRATASPSKFTATTSSATEPTDWEPFGTTQSQKETRAYFADGAPLLPILDAALAFNGARLYKGSGTPDAALSLYEKDGVLTYFKPKTLAAAAEEAEDETAETVDLTDAVPFARYPARILFPTVVLTQAETTALGTLTDYAALYDANREAYFPDEEEEEETETLTALCDKTTDETVGAFFAPKYWEFRKGDYSSRYLNQWETIEPTTENATSKCAPVILTRYFATVDSDGKVRNARDVRKEARRLNAVIETLATLPESYSLFFGARDPLGGVVCRLDDATIERVQSFSAFVPSPSFAPLFGDAPEPEEADEETETFYSVSASAPSVSSLTTTTDSDGNTIKNYQITAKIYLQAYDYTTGTGGDTTTKWRLALSGSSYVYNSSTNAFQYNTDDFTIERNPGTTAGTYVGGVAVLKWRGVGIGATNATGTTGQGDFLKSAHLSSPLTLALADNIATIGVDLSGIYLQSSYGTTTGSDGIERILLLKSASLTCNETSSGGIPVVTDVSLVDGVLQKTTKYLHFSTVENRIWLVK